MRAIPDSTKIKLMIDHGAKINAATVDGTTPLMMTAHVHTATELLRYLVRRGANFRATNKRGPGSGTRRLENAYSTYQYSQISFLSQNGPIP